MVATRHTQKIYQNSVNHMVSPALGANKLIWKNNTVIVLIITRIPWTVLYNCIIILLQTSNEINASAKVIERKYGSYGLHKISATGDIITKKVRVVSCMWHAYRYFSMSLPNIINTFQKTEESPRSAAMTNKPQPFRDTKRDTKRQKQTKPNKHKSNTRTKSMKKSGRAQKLKITRRKSKQNCPSCMRHSYLT